MDHFKLSKLAALWTLGLLTPALAGSIDDPQVIPGLGPQQAVRYGSPAPTAYRPLRSPVAYARPRPLPDAQPAADQPGRYGGGLLEFMMTGHDPTPAVPRYAQRRDYVATASDGQDASYGAPGPMEDQQYAYAPSAGPPGYEMPRRPVDPAFQRQEVAYDGGQAPGTIVIDTSSKFLYLVEGGGRALRYGVGVGKQGFLWHGEKTITRKAEWPGWTPPAEMVKRRPDLPSHMEGGIANPLGARALYLGSSLYRIHGTNEPDTIGTNVSSGCIRLTNDDVSDLFDRVKVGTRVIVM
jgi:lipoprotein-anchoring transpeptidase ErfK/SrfK